MTYGLNCLRHRTPITMAFFEHAMVVSWSRAA